MLLSGFLTGLVFFSRLWAANADEPVYVKAGGTAHLSPGSVTNPEIRSITWKHGPDIAMEWFKGNTDAYRHFKYRGSLNGSTGVMTITETIQSDSGTYTSEINGKITGLTRLLVVSPVSKPTLSKRCTEDMTSCVFTCEGSTTDAEPITYKWMSEEPIGTSTNKLSITKEDKRPWFSCALHNPVSNETSDQVQNPFSLINDSDRNRIGIIIGVIAVICFFLFICAFAIYISRRGKQGRMRLEGGEVGGAAQRGEVGGAVQAVGYRYSKDPGGVSNDTETSPLMSNGTATSHQEQLVDNTPAASPDTSIPANQDPGCVVFREITSETETSPLSNGEVTPNQGQQLKDQAAGSQDNNQTPDQPQTPAASRDTNNLTESLTTVAEVHEVTPNQEQLLKDQEAGSQDNNQTPNQLQTPAASPDTKITANQDPGCVVSHKNSNDTETSPLSNGEATPNQKQVVDDQAAGPQDNNQTPDQPQTPAASRDTNNLTVAEVHEVTPNQEQLLKDQEAGSQDNNQTPDQPQTPAASRDTNNSTESLTTVAEVHEVTSHQEQLLKDQEAGSQDNNQTPNQLQTPAASPDTKITANQDPGYVVLPEITSETETSPLSNGEATPNQKQVVDDQAAGPQDNNQTPDQPQTPAASPDTNIPANQDPGYVVLPEITSETEKSAVSVSSDQETPNKDQLVDDQAAGPEVKDQS